uniref:RAS (RAD and GEM)-like GTP binding 2 n=1 Tax=Neogobius melanostomus TaxID=47308 RepID=A0A8C6UBM8_9GOBI
SPSDTHRASSSASFSVPCYSMFLTTAPPLRRGSTPLPVKHQLRREEAVSEDCDWIPGLEEPTTLPITETAVPREESFGQTAAAQSTYHSHGGALRIVLLGQNGVGKSSLALSLAGQSDRSLSIDSETYGYECSVTVDDEDSKLIVYDNWKQDLSTLQCDVCILVFSVTDRRSFHRIAQLRLLLRESLPQTPIILVGNKSDLVRSREISSEEAQSSAMMFDCLYLELSASLEHGTTELLEAAVRTARGTAESLTSRAKRFLAGLVPRSYCRDRHRGSKIFRQKSRSCHDLSSL